jgi:tetratricopeptide (TPR) repeat protein
VVLYELLTDRFPYEVPTTNLYQAAVIIRERPARRPSEVDPSLRGDLEVILLKALEKEPDRRYGSAAELAQDLRRFLDDEPILARRPGPWEQIARWSRRHRWAAITVLLLVLALIAGTAGTSLGYLRATQAHAKAVEREHEAQRLREVARQEADRAEELSRFLMHMIAAPQPDELGADTRVVDVLSRVEGNLAAVLSDRPVLEASMRSFLGVTFVELSMPTRAEPHLRRGQELLREHRGESHLSTLLLGQQLAGCLWYLGRYEAGSKLARHSLDLLAESNVDSPRLRVLLLQAAARCQLELFDLSAAQKLLQESLALFDQFEPSSPNRSIGSIEHQLLAAPRCEFEASTYNELAKVSERQWLYSEAAEYYRRSLAVLEGCSTVDASSWIHTQSRLAQALVRCGEFSEAEQLLRPCIRRHEEVYGVLHAETLFTRKVLAGLLLKVDRLDEAERLFEQVRSEQSAVFGEFATETLVTQADLGKTILASRNQERTADGLGLLEEAYELQAEEYGSDHYGTLYVAEVLSDAYEKEGHLELLLELVEEARRAQPTSMVAQLYRRNLRLRGCSAQTQLGQFHESESELLDLQAETESAFGEQHPRNREVLRCLAGLYFAWGKPDKEEHYLSRWRALARTQE